MFQTDLAYRTLGCGLRLTEVPIDFVERERGDSKMTRQVASESLRKITRWGLSERRAQLQRRWERRYRQPRLQPAATPADRWNRRRTLGC